MMFAVLIVACDNDVRLRIMMRRFTLTILLNEKPKKNDFFYGENSRGVCPLLPKRNNTLIRSRLFVLEI